MSKSYKKLAWIVCIGLIVLWIGLTSFNKFKADGQVDALCKIEAKTVAYKKVAISNDEFQLLKKQAIPDIRFKRIAHPYYSKFTTTTISGNMNEISPSELVIYKSIYQIYLTDTHELLGEKISFARRGGDPFFASMPSSHSCDDLHSNIIDAIFTVIQ